MSESATDRRAIAISDVIGDRAGAYVATKLLCEGLTGAGWTVTCCVLSVVGETGRAEVVRPVVNKGWRWGVPGRVLAWQAARLVRRQRPELIICVGLTELTGWALGAMPADRVWVWELTNATPGNKFVAEGAVRRLARARGLLSPSATIDGKIRETYGYTGLIQRLPFWVEDAAPPGVRDRFEQEFLYLGRRDPDKGLTELVEAMAGVRRKFPGARLLVGGHGDDTLFRARAEALGLADVIEFRTFQTREEVARAMSASRWLVLPSRHEGYPLVLLEAARAGVPLIASSVGSIQEMFPDPRVCRLVPPEDVLLLTEAMVAAAGITAAEHEALQAEVRRRFDEISSSGVVAARLHGLPTIDSPRE